MLIRILYALRSYHAGGKSTYLHQLLKRLPVDKYRVTILTDQRGLVHQELGNLCEVEELPRFEHADCAAELRSYLRGRFDLAQSNGFGTALALACHSEGIPHLWRIGVRPDVGIKDFDPAILKGLTACVGVLSERVICPSKFLAEPFQEAAGNKIIIIRNATDLGPTPEGVSFSTAPTIAMVAHFLPQKRHQDFLLASKMVLEELPEARFVIYGESYNTDESKGYEECIRRQAPPECSFESFRGESRPHIEKSDIVVLPSVDEGASRAVIEAMACGRPVVASASGGNLEMVQDGETGFLVPPEQPSALARAILKLVRDPDLAGRFGRAGRERALELFSLKNLDRYATLYEEIAGGYTRCKT